MSTATQSAQSAWYEIEENFGDDELNQTCAWCKEPCSGGYRVAVDARHYGLCALCWGRAPAYLEHRQEGLEHSEALRRIGTA